MRPHTRRGKAARDQALMIGIAVFVIGGAVFGIVLDRMIGIARSPQFRSSDAWQLYGTMIGIFGAMLTTLALENWRRLWAARDNVNAVMDALSSLVESRSVTGLLPSLRGVKAEDVAKERDHLRASLQTIVDETRAYSVIRQANPIHDLRLLALLMRLDDDMAAARAAAEKQLAVMRGNEASLDEVLAFYSNFLPIQDAAQRSFVAAHTALAVFE